MNRLKISPFHKAIKWYLAILVICFFIFMVWAIFYNYFYEIPRQTDINGDSNSIGFVCYKLLGQSYSCDVYDFLGDLIFLSVLIFLTLVTNLYFWLGSGLFIYLLFLYFKKKNLNQKQNSTANDSQNSEN